MNRTGQPIHLLPPPPSQQPDRCEHTQSRLSEYMDGAVSGVEMQQIAAHLDRCPACSAEFALAARLQHTMVALGAVKAPADLGLKLRVAISQERARSWRAALERFGLQWQNAIRPLVLQASAGLAGALLLIGSIVALDTMGRGNPVMANDEPLGAITAPHYLYSIDGLHPVNTAEDSTLVIEAAINARGEVYDYRIVSGPVAEPRIQSEVAQRLATSVFQPASVFGLPVRGHVVITFSGVSVHA